MQLQVLLSEGGATGSSPGREDGTLPGNAYAPAMFSSTHLHSCTVLLWRSVLLNCIADSANTTYFEIPSGSAPFSHLVARTPALLLLVLHCTVVACQAAGCHLTAGMAAHILHHSPGQCHLLRHCSSQHHHRAAPASQPAVCGGAANSRRHMAGAAAEGEVPAAAAVGSTGEAG